MYCRIVSLDGDDALRSGVSRPVNLYLSRRDVTDCVDVTSAATNHTTDCVRWHQQTLGPVSKIQIVTDVEVHRYINSHGRRDQSHD